MNATQTYLLPQSLEQLLRLASQADATILAGGTDLVPRWSRDLVPKPASIVDIKSIEALRGIEEHNGEVHIGACTLMSELELSPIIRDAAPVLAEAVSRIACPQIRNRATLGGNLCNASPAADAAIPLLLLDAVLDIATLGPDGLATREVPIASFFTGPGATVLTPGDILTHIRFKPLPANRHAAWEKFGTRPAMEIAVASVGVLIESEDDRVVRARVGYGSVAPTPVRGPGAEAALVGERLTDDVIRACVAAARDEINPITDVRAGAAYRREIVGVMLQRMLEPCRM